MINEEGYVGLGLVCANVCTALDRGLNGKRLEDLNNSVCEAIEQLTTWVGPAAVGSLHYTDALNRSTVAEIQRNVIKRGKRNAASRFFHAKSDKETIATWRSDLNGILLVFNVRSASSAWPLLTAHSQTELAISTHVAVSDIRHGVANTHAIVSDIHRTMVKSQDGGDGKTLSVSATLRSACQNQRSHLPRLKPGQRSRPPINPVSYVYI